MPSCSPALVIVPPELSYAVGDHHWLTWICPVCWAYRIGRFFREAADTLADLWNL